MSTVKRIKDLERKRSLLVNELLAVQGMIPGSYNEVALKCGKKNCWCYTNRKLAHVSKRLTWSEGGTSKMKTIPNADASWVMEMIAHHREFRDLRRKLAETEKTLSLALKEYAKEIISNTRNERADLWKNPTYSK